MKSHSYFLKTGKGTYGQGGTQITKDDIYINHSDTSESLIQSDIIRDPASPNPVAKIWSGTQQQYNAILNKDRTTLYFISERETA